MLEERGAWAIRFLIIRKRGVGTGTAKYVRVPKPVDAPRAFL
jgi:hypothetical protein